MLSRKNISFFCSSSSKSVVTNALVLPFLTREDMSTQVCDFDR